MRSWAVVTPMPGIFELGHLGGVRGNGQLDQGGECVGLVELRAQQERGGEGPAGTARPGSPTPSSGALWPRLERAEALRGKVPDVVGVRQQPMAPMNSSAEVLESQPLMPDRASAMVIARSRMSTARSMSSFSITSEGMSWNRL